MSASTNSLVARGSKIGATALLAGTLIAGGAVLGTHNAVHAASPAAATPVAASSVAAAPLDANSVSALTALDQAMEAVTARVTPAIVNVAVSSKGGEHESASMGGHGGDDEDGTGMPGLPPGLSQFFGGGGRRLAPSQQPIEHGVGSGVVLSPDGYIVTNNHVVAGAININVTLHDRRILPAKVVGVDKLTDIAVIKVNAKDLTPIAWGDSTALHPGQTVLAFGSPFGSLQFSVTRGIVSALNRPNRFSDDARTPGDLIQTDAAINPGNSGGALVNARGELVGINNGIISSSGSFAGAGFAIPAQIAHATVDQLIAHGKVDHGYLGISLNDVTPANAHFFHLSNAEGAIVSEVSPDSPASRGGVKQGDVIAEVNGKRVLNGGALQVAVSQIAPGSHVKLGILRNGMPSTLDLTVGSFQPRSEVASADGEGDGQGSGRASTGKLGLGLADLSPDVRQQIQAPAALQGAVVESVRPGSPAEDAGLQPGDVIQEVNRKPAPSAKDLVAAVRQASTEDVLLLVWSHGNSSYRTLRPVTQN